MGSVKLTICGLPGVGKTTIFKKIFDLYDSSVTDPTIGCVEKKFTIERAEGRRSVVVCDTSGFDSNKGLQKAFFRECSFVFFVFDQNDRHSFESLSDLIHSVNDTCGSYDKILVRNKTDLESVVTDEDVDALINQHEITYYFNVSKNNLQSMKDAVTRFEDAVIKKYGFEKEQIAPNPALSRGSNQGIDRRVDNVQYFDSCCD